MTFTVEDVVSKVKSLGNARPHFNYVEANNLSGVTCLYVHDAGTDKQRPGCIVGTALYQLGLSLEELTKWEYHNASEIVGHYAKRPDLTKLLALDNVQEKQDNGYTWGEAIEAF